MVGDTFKRVFLKTFGLADLQSLSLLSHLGLRIVWDGQPSWVIGRSAMTSEKNET